MHEHDGLAGARAAGEPERPGERLGDVPALLGVEEDAPRAEVAGLDDLAQLVLALDERELRLRPRALERCEEVGVRVGGGLRGCELHLLDDVVDGVAGRQVDEHHADPGPLVHLGEREDRVLVRGRQGGRSVAGGEAEPVGEVRGSDPERDEDGHADDCRLAGDVLDNVDLVHGVLGNGGLLADAR